MRNLIAIVAILVSVPGIADSAEPVIHGIGFSPYLDGQSPPDPVTPQQIGNRLEIIAPHTGWIRTWNMRNGFEQIPAIASSDFALKVAACAFVDGDPWHENNDEIQKSNLIAAAIAGHVDIAIVGNEALVSGKLTTGELIAHLDDVRQRLDSAGFGRGADKFIPVAIAEPFGGWANSQPGGLFYRAGGDLQNAAVLEHVDMLFAHLYPFHEGVPIDDAIAKLAELYDETRSAVDEVVPGLPIVVGETGWPSDGNTNGQAVPTLSNLRRYFRDVSFWAGRSGVDVFYFAGFDENWKDPGYASVERHWGLHFADGTEKFPIPEPRVSTLATGALIALALMRRRAARTPAHSTR